MSSFLRTVNGSVPLFRIGTLCLITFLSTTSQAMVLLPWFSQCRSTDTLQHLIPFNFGIVLIYWTFYLACQDPGAVQDDYLPPNDLNARYCKTCQAFKPPRTHHCKSCRRCILRMDHHCPWLSSCVGYNNHAAFIKFMLCVVPTTGYLAVMMALKLWEIFTDPIYIKPETDVILFATLNFLGAAGVCIMVFCLLVYQLWNISENITTIESWSKKRTEELIRRKKIPSIEFPYDLYSFSDNLKEILGHHSPILWFWPPTRATGSGHSFPINEDSDITRPWPPADPVALASHATSNTRSEASTGISTTLQESKGLPSRTTSATVDDDYSYGDYATMGLISDSDDSDDYADSEGEDLNSFGVDDDGETTSMNEIIAGSNLTLAQLLHKRRLEHSDRLKLKKK